jgi:hypothetical protein
MTLKNTENMLVICCFFFNKGVIQKDMGIEGLREMRPIIENVEKGNLHQNV